MHQEQFPDTVFPEKIRCPFQSFLICIPEMQTSDNRMNRYLRMDFRTIADRIDDPCVTAPGDQEPRSGQECLFFGNAIGDAAGLVVKK